MDPNHSIPNLPPMTTNQAGQSPPMTTTNAHPPYAETIIAAISGGSDITEANFYAGGVSLEDPPSGLSKRKPGRPPKLKLPSSTENLPAVAKRGRGRPPKLTGDEGVVVPPFPSTENSPVVVKRGRGRPPKSTGDEGVVPPPPSENSPVVVKRGRGRPPKSTGGKVDASGGHVASSDAGGGGGGELQVVEVGSDSPVVKIGDNGVKVKRGRGRPRRFGIGPVTVPLSGNLLRPRGRPKKVAGPNVAVSGGTGEGVSGLRRRGRPSRILSGNLTGASLGKPAKGGLGTAVIVTDPQQLVVYQELKSKYELIQSKVKQMASIVKPCIDPVYENTALGVLQELEDLAGEANAPSHD